MTNPNPLLIRLNAQTHVSLVPVCIICSPLKLTSIIDMYDDLSMFVSFALVA
jgi:hypothetical protein